MRPRSGAPQVPAGPLAREPRGPPAAKRKRNRAPGPKGGGPAGPAAELGQSCPRAPGPCVLIAAGAGVASRGEARTWQRSREPGRPGPAPSPGLHQKGGERAYKRKICPRWPFSDMSSSPLSRFLSYPRIPREEGMRHC